jgi:uncharacterized protein
MILAFGGDIITTQEVQAMGEAQGNAIQIGLDLYINLEPPSCYANHSCAPNAGVKHDTILVALRDIERDQEICYDYSTTMSENDWTLGCLCGAPQCRRVIQDFHLLPTTLKRRYVNQCIVQSFIVAEYQSAANSPSPQSRYRVKGKARFRRSLTG